LISVSLFEGQNHPINVIVSGTSPQTNPQGVKMLAINRNVVANDARNGQIVGPGSNSR
jgi:hypothetical protein